MIAPRPVRKLYKHMPTGSWNESIIHIHHQYRLIYIPIIPYIYIHSSYHPYPTSTNRQRAQGSKNQTTMPSFEDLPFEILSQILTLAAELNVNEEATYTYGLTQAPRSNQRHPLQRYVRGRVPTDVLRWNTVNSYRLVNSRWHHWALSYALKDVYVRRWRGGEQ